MVSIIQFCSACIPHQFQDERYGFKMRVMNPTGKGEKSGVARCTVCKATHNINSGSVRISKKK